jgi:hypothetical protein
MKTFKILSVLMIAALLFVAIGPSHALAGAYEATWATSITYQNIGTGPTTTLSLLFYADPNDTNPTIKTMANLAQGASTSVFVGGLLTGTFRGTAVMSADQPMAAVLVQLVPTTGSPVKVRPLSNGFSSGTPTTQIPSVFKDPALNTQFAVQNAGTTATVVTLRWINTSATQVLSSTQNLQPGAGLFVDAGTWPGLPATFNGSVILQSSSGSLVSSAMELYTGGNNTGAAFEGVGQGATTIYMPSAFCKASSTTTFFALQNPDLLQTATATVHFSYGAPNVKTVTVGPGAKASVGGCAYDAGGVDPTGMGGSAYITSNIPIVALGKVNFATTPSAQTAFVGFADGAAKIALPYVRWASPAQWPTGNYQRTFIAVQNISGFDLPADSVTVKYVDGTGAQQGTIHSLGAMVDKSKLSSSPNNAGLGGGFGFTAGGGAIVTCSVANCKLAVVARVNTYVNASASASEDYSGIPMP